MVDNLIETSMYTNLTKTDIKNDANNMGLYSSKGGGAEYPQYYGYYEHDDYSTDIMSPQNYHDSVTSETETKVELKLAMCFPVIIVLFFLGYVSNVFWRCCLREKLKFLATYLTNKSETKTRMSSSETQTSLLHFQYNCDGPFGLGDNQKPQTILSGSKLACHWLLSKLQTWIIIMDQTKYNTT